MGLYIKDLGLPEGCAAVTLKVWPDGEVEIIDEDGEWKETKAVPVLPHGRLGDLDKLEQKALIRSERRGRLVNVTDMVISAYDIALAPTIIPAEEES